MVVPNFDTQPRIYGVRKEQWYVAAGFFFVWLLALSRRPNMSEEAWLSHGSVRSMNEADGKKLSHGVLAADASVMTAQAKVQQSQVEKTVEKAPVKEEKPEIPLGPVPEKPAIETPALDAPGPDTSALDTPASTVDDNPVQEDANAFCDCEDCNDRALDMKLQPISCRARISFIEEAARKKGIENPRRHACRHSVNSGHCPAVCNPDSCPKSHCGCPTCLDEHFSANLAGMKCSTRVSFIEDKARQKNMESPHEHGCIHATKGGYCPSECDSETCLA